MKTAERRELEEKERGVGKSIKRILHRPSKTAPASENLRGWAESALRSRNKK